MRCRRTTWTAATAGLLLLASCNSANNASVADPSCQYLGVWQHQFGDKPTPNILTISRSGSQIFATMDSPALVNGRFPVTVEGGSLDAGVPYGKLVVDEQRGTLLVSGAEFRRTAVAEGC